MDRVFEILECSKKVRVAKRNAIYNMFNDEFNVKQFNKNSKDVGFLGWLFYINSQGNLKEVNFDYAMLSKDNDIPFLYCVGDKFKKISQNPSSEQRFNGIKVKTMPDWAKTLKNSSKKDLNLAKSIALDGILQYNKGKVTKNGKKLVNYLNEECEFLGFVPHVAYVMHSSNSKRDLSSVWIHVFAQRTLLYKIVDRPCLILVNSSIELDDSALAKIEGNENIRELKNIKGITG